MFVLDFICVSLFRNAGEGGGVFDVFQVQSIGPNPWYTLMGGGAALRGLGDYRSGKKSQGPSTIYGLRRLGYRDCRLCYSTDAYGGS